MTSKTKPCGQPIDGPGYLPDGPGCYYPRKRTKTKCVWHWLLSQPIEQQVRAASLRAQSPHFVGIVRKVVPEREWPAGERWCAGCQTFIPFFYATGSRCKACASQANHASHVRRTYDLDPEEYQRLLDWQGGRCYVCGQMPRVRRLAVDHDHRTGEVRGLLCSNDEWGCNVMLARILNDAQMVKRLVEYVERYPLQRMRDGEPAKEVIRRPTVTDGLRDWRPRIALGIDAQQRQAVDLDQPWRPFD